MNFVSPSETKAFKEAVDILIEEGLITVAENGQYMLTIKGFDYCKSHYKEFPNEQWWPDEQINKANLEKVIGK
jgi:predicted transcriptional regulator